MEKLLGLIEKHGTKIIGYVTQAAAFIAIADANLVADTLGPKATAWALLITGILVSARGHQATRAEKRAVKQASQKE